MHSAVRAVQVSVHLCVRKNSEKNFPLLSFRLLKRTLTPLQVAVAINFTKKVDLDETTSEEKEM
jgi:hypothetical protein